MHNHEDLEKKFTANVTPDSIALAMQLFAAQPPCFTHGDKTPLDSIFKAISKLSAHLGYIPDPGQLRALFESKTNDGEIAVIIRECMIDAVMLLYTGILKVTEEVGCVPRPDLN